MIICPVPAPWIKKTIFCRKEENSHLLPKLYTIRKKSNEQNYFLDFCRNVLQNPWNFFSSIIQFYGILKKQEHNLAVQTTFA